MSMAGSNWAVYELADALKIEIIVNGNIGKGEAMLPISFGPVNMRFPVRLETDFIKPGECGAFLHVRGSLYAYAFAKTQQRQKPVLGLAFFDGTGKIFSDFRTGDAKTTLKNLSDQKRLAAGYVYTSQLVGWTKIPDEHLRATFQIL